MWQTLEGRVAEDKDEATATTTLILAMVTVASRAAMVASPTTAILQATISAPTVLVVVRYVKCASKKDTQQIGAGIGMMTATCLTPSL